MHSWAKKWMAVCCAAVLLLCLGLPGAGAEPAVPEGYPALRIDPDTGAPYDFGGQTIYLYNYWGGYNDYTDPVTETEAIQYAYYDWLWETYHFRIIQDGVSDWGSIAGYVIDFCDHPDGRLCYFIIPPDFASQVVFGNACAKWNTSGQINWSDPKWNAADQALMTVGDGLYGVSTGNSEPRTCVFFNKRVLEEAGIDWNDIYDMQQAGTWTWAVFESMLSTIQRDTDNDGVIDVFGMTGSSDDMYRIAVFANESTFFDVDGDGKLYSNVTSSKTKEALAWAKRVWDTYSYKRAEGDSWDYYKQAWLRGNCGFYVYQAYGGFNDNSEMSSMADDWGCVAFPVNRSGANYVTITSNNITVIPNAYSAKTVKMLQVAYDLWSTTIDSQDGDWIGNKYNYTDERAVDETYAMLRDPAHNVTDKCMLLGSVNDVEGSYLLWGIQEGDLDMMLEETNSAWGNICENFNESIREVIDLSQYTQLELPNDLMVIESEAFAGTAAEVVFIPSGCTAILAGAFDNCPNLIYAVLPVAQEIEIAPDAFPEGVEVLYR